ncbi:MAG: MFS transporter [Clostridiales Family XIII bacterium]|jgi:fucose permease|nr:MFS transporter [Clostridiales Family XIII bacterium]
MTYLLIIIYIAFISLGLPDALLGSAWPAMHIDISAPLSAAGLISLIVSAGTIISSLMSNRLVVRFKTGKVTMVSVFMTAAALLGISFAGSLWQLCLFAVPLGLGAGSVDAALNNFVSLHYKARHMNWLHCFWGIGATCGPMIMAFFLAQQQGWKMAYRVIFLLQIILTLILLFSLPLWKKAGSQGETHSVEAKVISNREALRIKGIKYALFGFMCYCGYEATTGLWTSSFLVMQKGISVERAALWASLFYAGISLGRVLAGFLSSKLSAQTLIRFGCIIGICGVGFLFLPGEFALPGVALIGFGGAPFYPQMIHETPRRFGKEASGAAMGLQMACAYVGTTAIPPIVGLLSRSFSLSILPIVLLILEIGAFVLSEKISTIKFRTGEL